MKTTAILLIALFTGLGNLYSSDFSRRKLNRNEVHDKLENTRNTVFTFDLIGPSIGFETKLSNKSSLLMAYSSGEVYIYDGFMTKEYFVPNIKGEIRSYYNLNRRAKRGQRINKFSGNFISLYTSFRPEYMNTNQEWVIGPTWGIQRAYMNFIHLSLNVGYGYVFDQDIQTSSGTAIVDFKLGFVF